MKKIVFLVIVFLAISIGNCFAQTAFDQVSKDQTASISDRDAMTTMDKYADQDKEKLAGYLKTESKKYISINYVSAHQALQTVNKIGRQKVLVDKNAIIVNNKIVPSYTIIIPE